MPVYCFQCPKCGTNSEVVRPMADAEKPLRCSCKAAMVRDLKAEHGGRRITGGWPMVSTAAGINPDEVEEFKKIDARHGVPTQYTPDGDPIFTSRSHRKRYLQLHNLFDRDAGYSDAAPRNR